MGCSKIISVDMRQQVFAFSDVLFEMTNRFDLQNRLDYNYSQYIRFSIDLNVSHHREPKNENKSYII